MIDFTFHNPTKLIFGKNPEVETGREMGKVSRRVLLHYGGGSIKKNGVYQSVVASLKDAGVEFVELSGVKPNPRLSLVREGIELCKREGLDGILAVGGGSTIDSAKAIALGVSNDEDVWKFYTGEATPVAALPIGVVLTIPAAGSESSPSSVITWEEKKMKYDVSSETLRPVFAVLNPTFTYTLPDYQTACGASDMLAHVMERYFTNEAATDYSDRLCEATMTAIVRNAQEALRAPNDYPARAELMWAGTIAHNDLLGRGREEDWSSHVIEHELSAQYDVAHGAGLSVVFPAWMRHVYKANLPRFVQFAVRVWGVDYYSGDLEWCALEGIRRLIRFYRSIGMPTTLKALGVTDNRYEVMAKQATRRGPLGAFKKLDASAVVEIYKLGECDEC